MNDCDDFTGVFHCVVNISRGGWQEYSLLFHLTEEIFNK